MNYVLVFLFFSGGLIRVGFLEFWVFGWLEVGKVFLRVFLCMFIDLFCFIFSSFEFICGVRFLSRVRNVFLL